MERNIGFELKSIANLVKRFFEDTPAHKKHATPMHGFIVGYLIKNKDKSIYQKDIENVMSMRSSTVSRMLSLMEQNGMIERLSDESDSRLKRIIATKEAEAMHELMKAKFADIEKIMKQGIEKEELQIFFKVIDKIKINLERNE